MKKIFHIFIVFTFLFLTLVPNIKAQARSSNEVESYIIKSNNPEKTELRLKDLGVSNFEKIDSLGAYVVNLEKETLAEKLDIISREDSTVYVEKNKKTKISETPNDPYFSYQTYLQSSGIINAWNTTTGSPNIIVAVIDTGIDYNHEDLKNSIWSDSNGYHGYDFVNIDHDPMDDNGHGTAIAGIIAAGRNNGIGVTGATNVKIMSVKAVPDTGEGDVVDLAHAITYAADNGARVANVSLGLIEESSLLDDSISYAKNKGCLVVAATGNMYRSFIDNPARNPSAIGVSAINEYGSRANYANYGTGTSITALGNRIFSTSWSADNPNNLYEYLSGTSFATPQVTATAALILSADPSLTTDQLKKRIESSAKKISSMLGYNYTEEYGYGQLDAANALGYDKTPPKMSLSLSKNMGGNYIMKGTVSDDNNSSDILPNIPDSNIRSLRYKVDGQSWVSMTLDSSAQPININSDIGPLSSGDHVITIEGVDTAGNTQTQALNTKDASTPTYSSSLSDYQYELIDQSSFINTSPGQTTNMAIVFKNIGNIAWDKNRVHLGTSRQMDRSSIFNDKTWLSPNRIAMQEDYVAVGQLAHFNFSITTPNGIYGNFNEYFNLVVEGTGWMHDIGIYWKIVSEGLSYHAKFTNQSPYLTMSPGEEKTFWVEYQNSGSATWSPGNVSLGTSEPLDRTSPFYNQSVTSGWKSANRISMGSTEIKPGEIARFSFTAHAPTTPGTYTEHFRPVADGITWMEDFGLFWKITIQ